MSKNENTLRKIYITGAIDDSAFARFSEELDVLLMENPKRPINIEICSYGGEDNSAFAFYGKMMSSTAPLYITAFGEIQSAAVLLLACGDRRYADAQVQFMVHESNDRLKGETHQLLRAAKRMELSEDHYYGLLAKHSQRHKDIWRELARRTTYFDSQSALDTGIIDKIIGERKNR